MRPSEWPLRYKVLAVVLYAAIMGAVAWGANVFVNSLSRGWLQFFVIAMLVGGVLLIVFGQLAARRDRRRNSSKGVSIDRRPGGFE